MKSTLKTLFWPLACIILTILLHGLDYSWLQSFQLSLIFVPSALLLRWQMPKITSSRYNSKAFNLVLLILSALLLQLLLILCVHAYWGERSIIDYSFHIYPIMTSPVFLLLLLGAFAYGNYLWCLYLDKTMKADNVAVSFISDRKKVSVPKQSILFIESRDKEVWVYTVDGNHYRNKTPISQWENVLGFEFVRIHRAYLVSKCAICGFDDETVSIAQHSLPVSKKYKGALQELLRQQPQT